MLSPKSKKRGEDMEVSKHMEINVSLPSMIAGAKAQIIQIEFDVAAVIAPCEGFPRKEMEAAIDALEQRFLKLKDTRLLHVLTEYNKEAAATIKLFGNVD